MIKSIFNFAAGTMLGLSVLMPTALQSAKAALLFICLILALYLMASNLFKCKKNSLSISFEIYYVSLIYVFVGLAWSLYGLILGNPGAIPTMTVMVAYPLLFPILTWIYRKNDGEKLRAFFISMALVVSLFDISFISSSLIWPDNLFSNYVFELYGDEAVIDDSEDYFKFTIPNISSVIFLLPFVFLSIMNSKVLKKTGVIAVIFLIFVIVLSGRRAAFITPIIGIFLAYILTSKNFAISFDYLSFKRLFWFAILIILISIAFMNFYGADFYLDQIYSIFNFSSNESNILRALQFKSLMAGISDSPFFGAGSGAVANYLRSDTQPWAYELSYVAFVFQYGFIGFLIYFFGILSIILLLIFNSRNYGRGSFEYPFLAGFLSFMLANATNPYLAKFDYMWVLYLPIALFNLKNTKLK